MDKNTTKRSTYDIIMDDRPSRKEYTGPVNSKGNPIGKTVRLEAKIGRNEPCPCDSGLKFKKCCKVYL